MMRLTVHIENAPFETKVQKNLGYDKINKIVVLKPKYPKCIMNTLTVRNLRSMAEVNKELSYIKDKYKVTKWKSGKKKDQEMIYISNQ